MQEMQSETRIVGIAFKGKKRALTPRKPRTLRKFTSKKKKPAKRKIKRSTLVNKLDAIFSTWTRTRFASENGMVKCYTCDKTAPIKSMQNGHYVSRSVRKLRWEPDNCRPQCYGCNVMHGGNPITFRENLVKELGETYVLELESLRHELFSPSDEWLSEQITTYTNLTKLEEIIISTP